MMDVADATNALQLMLAGRNASVSVIARPGVIVDSEQFASATQDVASERSRAKVQRDLPSRHVGERRDRAATTM